MGLILTVEDTKYTILCKDIRNDYISGWARQNFGTKLGASSYYDILEVQSLKVMKSHDSNEKAAAFLLFEAKNRRVSVKNSVSKILTLSYSIWVEEQK